MRKRKEREREKEKKRKKQKGKKTGNLKLAYPTFVPDSEPGW